MALRRDAVVGNDVAHEVIIASTLAVERVVGMLGLDGWKRSGYVASGCSLSTRRIM